MDEPAQPVTAWAVVDKDGRIWIGTLGEGGEKPKWALPKCNEQFPDSAPFRITRVRIEEIIEPGQPSP